MTALFLKLIGSDSTDSESYRGAGTGSASGFDNNGVRHRRGLISECVFYPTLVPEHRRPVGALWQLAKLTFYLWKIIPRNHSSGSGTSLSLHSPMRTKLGHQGDTCQQLQSFD